MADFWRSGSKKPSHSSSSSSSSSFSSATKVPEEEDERELVPEGGDEERRSRNGGEGVAIYNPNESYSISVQRSRLPIYEYRRDFLYLIENFQTVIVVGQTGCGKTTQIPQYLREAGWCADGKVVASTQPRRIAAREVAARVAVEMGEKFPFHVGYAVRFDEAIDAGHLQIKFMTDGLLVREMMLDPLLTRYSCIMLDEAHERSLYTDVCLGLLKKVLRKRPDLRLIVSSATLDAEEFFDFFNNPSTVSVVVEGSEREEKQLKHTAAVISVPGRTFPIDIFFSSSPVKDYRQATIETVLNIHRNEPEGDILCFLTGQDEIEFCASALRDQSVSSSRVSASFPHLKVLPIYSGLPVDQQRMIFESYPMHRKVILATNIAETSITIPGIVYVVDCGFVKVRICHPDSGTESLAITPISQSAASQRAGRAGRTKAGKCFRLYTEQSFLNDLAPNSVPEIQRTNLAPVCVQLKALGIDNLLKFDFMSPPPVDHLVHSLELLYALGALDDSCKLTPTGMKLVEFPVEPNVAKMIIAGAEYGCSEEVISIAAMLSIPPIFSSSRSARKAADKSRIQFGVKEGDHITLLNIFEVFRKAKNQAEWCKQHSITLRSISQAVDVRSQLRNYAKRFQIPLVSILNPKTSSSSSSSSSTSSWVNQSKKNEEIDPTPIQKAIAAGFFANAAQKMPDGTYKMVRGGKVLHLHRSSVMFYRPPEWIVFHEVVRTSLDYIREVCAVEPSWLSEVAPHYFRFRSLS